MKFVSLIFITIGCLSPMVFGANILAIFHMPTRSHYILGSALAKGLAVNGHEITIASSFNITESIPNIKDLYIDGTQEIAKALREVLGTMHNTSMIDMIIKTNGFTDKMTELVLNSTSIQKLLASNEKFDLVIFEGMLNEALFGIAHQLNAPFVVLSTSGSLLTNHLTGNMAPYSFVPTMHVNSSDRMTFTERLINSASGFLFHLALHFKIIPNQEDVYRNYFKDGPELSELSKNVSLILVNSHVCLETPRPYLPNMITIGGYHIAEPKKLPQDLQIFLDEAKEGAIFFSLGSNLKSSDLPKEKLNFIMETFKKLPQKILWKFEEDDLPGKPDNVKISKWFPQNDILAHPNIKLFISHGGLLSSTEAVYRGVPIIGIPFYGDQKSNTMNFVTAGYGLLLNFDDLTEESFTQTLQEIVTNSKYRENVQRRSAIIQDQPEKPLDRAVFWIEHVMRHNGGQHLRSAVVDLTLSQYLLLDVVAFVAVIAGTLATGTVLVCKVLCTKLKQMSDRNQKKEIKPKNE